MDKRKDYFLFKIIKQLLYFFYPKIEIIGNEKLPEEPCIIVGNHSQMHGPIACELFLPDNCYTWCAGQMMKLQDVPSYAYKDFWSQKPKYLRPLFKLVSYIIAPLSVCIFNNARTIGVYHDNRVLSTFKNTVKSLNSGNNVVVFPEYDKKHNNIIYDFQDKFIDVARLYHKKTGNELLFVPLYIAPKLKSVHFGTPVRFNASAEADSERQRICKFLMNGITSIAVSLPLHTVVPYRNIPKKLYPKNIPLEAQTDEKTHS